MQVVFPGTPVTSPIKLKTHDITKIDALVELNTNFGNPYLLCNVSRVKMTMSHSLHI